RDLGAAGAAGHGESYQQDAETTQAPIAATLPRASGGRAQPTLHRLPRYPAVRFVRPSPRQLSTPDVRSRFATTEYPSSGTLGSIPNLVQRPSRPRCQFRSAMALM